MALEQLEAGEIASSPEPPLDRRQDVDPASEALRVMA